MGLSSIASMIVALFCSSVLASNAYCSIPNTFPTVPACASHLSAWSCENTTAIENTCCSPTPGGLVLHTQFWSTYTGREKFNQKLPKSSWTIHGLWPDNCDGSYEQYCDLSRQYDPNPSPSTLPDGTIVPAWTGPGVDNIIKTFGRNDLLDFMNSYWINQGAPNSDLWGHEFSKHATCTSTFDVACYGESYRKDQEVINYFDASIRSFHAYPTFDILASAGIVPSNTTAYSFENVQNALKAQTGAIPFLGCKNGTILTEVWYFSHVYGTQQYGAYKALDSTTRSSCDSTKSIWYYERSEGSEREARKR